MNYFRLSLFTKEIVAPVRIPVSSRRTWRLSSLQMIDGRPDVGFTSKGFTQAKHCVFHTFRQLINRGEVNCRLKRVSNSGDSRSERSPGPPTTALAELSRPQWRSGLFNSYCLRYDKITSWTACRRSSTRALSGTSTRRWTESPRNRVNSIACGT